MLPISPVPQIPKRRRRWIPFMLILCLSIITASIGFIFGYASPRTVSTAMLPEVIRNMTHAVWGTSSGVDVGVFDSVWKTVHESYVDQKNINDKQLFYGMLKGFVGGLGDPYSSYLDPTETELFTKDLEGTFEGIGAEIGIKSENVTIIAPLANSPAEKAGLQPNDIVMEINGQSTSGMELDRAISLIRGKRGTQVKLLIRRQGLAEPKLFEITRDTIKSKSVAYRMDGNIAIITLSTFSQDTSKEFDDAVNALALQNPKGIILDMRNNPGGLLETSVDVANVFLPKDTVVVIEEGAKGQRDELKTNQQGKFIDTPLVVLINGGSASASEIVAGALKDQGRAKLIGEKSFGKGTVQTFEVLSDGSSLKVTIAKWLTPKGLSFSGTGIEPDTVVKLTTDDYNNDKDPQLEEALKSLR